jgi:GT2 family glycosyltransferase
VDASLILSSFKRPELLKLGLSSIVKNRPAFDLEIVVVNDGIPDETESVCQSFSQQSLNIKYVFSGQRNKDGIKKRVSGYALNIGVKQCSSDIIVLSCPEVYHLNDALDIIVSALERNPRKMVIPELIYFDQSAVETNKLLKMSLGELFNYKVDTTKLVGGDFGRCHGTMNFLMALYKKEFTSIGGFDEDFTGYAGEDSDLIQRFMSNGLTHLRTSAEAVHLWHPGSNNGEVHWDNPAWVYNWNILQSRKGILVRNKGREWGKIDE